MCVCVYVHICTYVTTYIRTYIRNIPNKTVYEFYPFHNELNSVMDGKTTTTVVNNCKVYVVRLSSLADILISQFGARQSAGTLVVDA